MKIRNINKVLYTNGGTSDIIRVVMMAYDIESDPQIYELAEQLKGSTTVETCQNIWNFLVDNIRYAADSDGDRGEMVRTPARLIHDGTGDCKSYSLFTAVILRYLKIPHVFRFASYSTQREATHVYVVAFDTERETRNAKHGTRNAKHEIVIDAVSKQQLNSPFGVEKKYNYKCDMANGGTKISYLAGYNTGQKANKRIGYVPFNTIPISKEAILNIDTSLMRLQAGYDVNPSDYNREQLNISKLLVHIATKNNLDVYRVSKGLWGIAYLSKKGSLTHDFETVKAEFDSIDYNIINENNIDKQLFEMLTMVVFSKKKIPGIGFSIFFLDLRSKDQKRKRLIEILNAWSAMYFFIWFYTDDEIVQKFQNSTELLKKKKFVGIFLETIYNETKMVKSAFFTECRKDIEAVNGFAMTITQLKAKIESGIIPMPRGYEGKNLPQLIRDNTANLENVIDIWYYIINDGVIDFSKEMVANVIPIDDPYTGGGTTGGGTTGGDEKETPKSNTGLILGALSALLLLR